MPASRAWTLCLLLALSACASAPTRYFVLQPQPQAAARPVAAAGPQIVIDHVIIPDELDRPGYVSYGADGALAVSHRNRWGAPIGRMVQAAIAGDLAADLPGRVVPPGDPAPAAPYWRLTVNLRHFAADATGRVRLTADWVVRDGQGARVSGESLDIVRAAGSAAPARVVPVMDAMLSEMAGRIAVALRGRSAG